MNYKTITMPADAKYLSDFMPELPIGIFNKKVTNTGATTLVLENLQNVILVSPTNNLIANKMRQYPNKRCKYELFAVNGGVTSEDVITYIHSCEGKQPVKLISTPDSLYKITCLTDVYKNYHLVVDEFHELIKMMGNRQPAALRLMNDFSKFAKFTFLSATPLKENYLPSPLNTLNYHTLEVANFVMIKAIPMQTNKPFGRVSDIIKNFKMKGEFLINGNSTKHLYFYINTVTNICSIIKNTGLEAKDVNIICADTAYNKRILSIVGCEIGEFITEDELINPINESPIHFITSTAFQGSDIYSNDGMSFFITDCHVKSTMSGMATLQQISGRIRTKTNPFNGTIYHIFNVNKSTLTFDEYLKEQLIQIDDSKGIIKDWETNSEGSKKAIKRDLYNAETLDYTVYHYLDETDNKMKLNDLLIKADQYNHEVENKIYTEGIEVRKAYAEQGLDMTTSNNYLKIESAFNSVIIHQDFKGYCTAYNESLNATFYIGEPLFGCPEKTQKLIITAFKKLGYSKIENLKFHQTNIKKHLKIALSFNTYGEITAVNKVFKIGGRYPKAEIKETLRSIYSKLDIKKSATAIRIREYFEADECLLENGNKGLILSKKVNTVFKKQDPETRIGIMNERAA